LALDANIKAIKYGSGVTLSSLTANFSTVAPTFVTQISQDLRWLAILNATTPITATWNDGTNTLAMYPVAAGTVATYGDNLITNGAFATDVSNWGTTAPSTITWAAPGKCNIARGGGTAFGQCLQAISARAGNILLLSVHIISRSNMFGANYYDINTQFFTASGTATIGVVSSAKTAIADNGSISLGGFGSSSATASVDDVSVVTITAPDATGFTASDLSGASFNPNAATFTLNIVRR